MRPDPPEQFPPARVIPPLNPPHRQTIILLHGRGLSWSTFGADLLSTEFHAPYPADPATASMIEGGGHLDKTVAPLSTLQTRYPHAKFIFPLAPRRRATIYARSMIHQWFDGWHLAPPVSPESEDESSEDDLLESFSKVDVDSGVGANSEDGFEPNSGASGTQAEVEPRFQSQTAHTHQNQQHQHQHQKQHQQHHDKLHQQKHHRHLQRRREAQEEWRGIPGLQETITYLHDLIRHEAALFSDSPSSTTNPDDSTNPHHGTHNIILGGLSQGCAASLAALLLWDGEALGGYWGMCGWLVFESVLKGIINAESGGGCKGGSGAEGGTTTGEEVGFDPFEQDEGYDGGEGEDKGAELSIEAKVVRELKEQLELTTTTRGMPSVARPKVFDTPVFLGHGMEDDKVPVGRGREASECLRAAGMDVKWKAYEGLGHWYSPQMLVDMCLLQHVDHVGN